LAGPGTPVLGVNRQSYGSEGTDRG